MKIIHLIYLLLFAQNLPLANQCFAQAPDIVWQKSIGGVKDDYAYAIDVTSDSGLIVAGISYSNEGDVSGHHGTQYRLDLWITKLNAIGNLIWQRSLGGPEDDGAYTVLQTSDGGYLTGGYSQSNSGDVSGHHGGIGIHDCWIVKLNAEGIMEWQRSFGGTSSDYVRTVIETPDSGYIFIGDTYSNDYDVSGNHGKSDIWVVKLNSIGEIIWQKTFGGSENDYSNSIQQTDDGGFIISGDSYSNNGDVDLHYGSYLSADTWIIKLNADGEMEWQKIYGGTFSEYSKKIIQSDEGGYIFIANAQSDDYDLDLHHGDTFYPDLWVVKITYTGEIEWQKIIGGDSYDMGFEIEQTNDLSYIISGETSSIDGDVFGNNGLSDLWMLKLDSAGELIWQKCFGGTSADYRGNFGMISDTSFVFSGFSHSHDGDVTGNQGGWDFWVGKMGPCTAEVYYADFDEDGYGNISSSILNCEMPFGFVVDSTDCDDDDASINPGAEEIVNGIDDNCDDSVDEGVSLNTENAISINIFPNPATDILNIETEYIENCTLSIFNLDGTLITALCKIDNKNVIDISNMASGIYLIKVQNQNHIQVYKFLKK